MHSFDIDLKNISKIEGHTHLEVKVRKGKINSCKLKISQGKRFLAQAVLGKKYNEISPIMSRICGTCSSAHVVCSIKAIENAFGTKVSSQTNRLRKLLLNANHLRDHAMHLYFFVLPDIFGKESVLDFNGKLHFWVHYGLDVKSVGNHLSKIIGGRAVHPPAAVVGGFTKFPTKKEIIKIKKELKGSRGKILELIDLLYNNRFDFSRKTNYLALVNKDYNFLDGKIKTAYGSIIEEKDFLNHLERVVLPYSNADAFEFESEEYFVGALARINLNKNKLNVKTKKDVEKYLDAFPSDNPFDNNLAQAIEMLLIVDNSLDLLKEEIKEEKIKKIIPKKSIGLGVVEAPRGHLFFKIGFDSKGLVKESDFCIPTQQNVIHMENSIAKRIEGLLKKPKKEIEFEVEKMIRAYDPCMSCAAHFLKIDWS
jgi:sulfhydrogenase subunit alpha